MVRKLTEDDGRIVDMLLDAAGNAPQNPMLSQVFTSSQPAMFEKRLDSIERVLSLLDQMPASDPPADLVNRTLSRIEEREYISGTARTNSIGTNIRPQA
jgi:hypothetical protein